MSLAAASPVLWPFEGTDALLNVSLVMCISAMLLALPLGWVLIRRTLGFRVAGPLWPLLFFEIFATFYAFMTPPWLMPDEPQHMYYAELVREGGTSIPEQMAAGRLTDPEQAQVAGDLFRGIVASAKSSQMSRWLPGAEAELSGGGLPGPTEIFHPPLYYVVAGGLTSPFGEADIFARLALLRTFGVMLTGWVVWLCGAAGRIIWPGRRRIAEVPLVLAAGVPTLAAFAGAVNNDAIANLLGALLLTLVAAAATGHARRRPWLWLGGFALTVGLGLLTKRTILPLVLAAPTALAFRYVLQLRRLLALAIAGQLILGAVALSLPAQRLALWELNGLTRDYRCPGGVVGPTAICLEPSANEGIRQNLSLAAFRDLAGRPATIGFWARGAADDRVRIVIGEGASAQVQPVPVKPQWQWHSFQFLPSAEAGQLSVGFGGSAGGRLDMDGVTLARGRFSEKPPVFGEGARITWDGRPTTNLLLNGSGEGRARSAPMWVPTPARRVLQAGLDQASRMAALWPDTSRSLDVVSTRLEETFGMFWATVGWEVPPLLLPAGLLLALAALVASGWLGALLQVLRPGRAERGPTSRGVGALGVCFAVACFAVVARGLPPDRALVISGRYLFAALVAGTVMLAAGWRRFWPNDDRTFRNAVRWFALSTHLVFIVAMFFPFLAR